MSAPDPPIDIESGVRLRPVLELEPGSFGSCPAPGPGPWTPEQSFFYWRTCLAEGGIRDLPPIQPGSCLVSTEDVLAPFPLSRILEAHLAGKALPEEIDEIASLPGGIALCRDEEPILLPTCCSDLADLAEWKKAAARRSDAPEMLWIGHPWCSSWFADGWIHVREEEEYPGPRALRTMRLRPAALEAAIADADREIVLFRDKLLTVLPTTFGPARAMATASALVGLPT